MSGGQPGAVHDALRGEYGARVAKLLEHTPAALGGRDAEAVHQARVATRRMRELFRTFRPLIDAEAVRPIARPLKKLAGLLGDVRDADVLLERLEGLGGSDDAGPFCRSLAADILKERETALEALTKALRSDRHAKLVTGLSEGTEVVFAPAARAAPTDATALVAAQFDSLARKIGSLGDDPPDDDLHAIRITAKRVRYASEALAPIGGKGAQRLARCAARVQTTLGEHQDAAVLQSRVRRWRREHEHEATDAEQFGAGIVFGMQVAAMRSARALVVKEFDDVLSEKNTRWL